MCLKALTGVNQRNYKRYLRERNNFIAQFRHEAKIHRTLENPGLIRYIDFHEAGKAPAAEGASKKEVELQEAHRVSHYILIEHAHHGDLFDFSVKTKQPVGEVVGRYLFKQIVESVTYLHKTAKVVHRDLKLENILLDKHNNVKICDFAMSKSLLDNQNMGIFYSQCGSWCYMAPEIIESRPYKGSSVDIFALGVILFALVTGVMPFGQAERDSDQLYSLIAKAADEDYWQLLHKTH
jgi:serine/threonine protein kinase